MDCNDTFQSTISPKLHASIAHNRICFLPRRMCQFKTTKAQSAQTRAYSLSCERLLISTFAAQLVKLSTTILIFAILKWFMGVFDLLL